MRHPGPRAWTSVRATEPSSQTLVFAAVIQAGLDTTVLLVRVGGGRAERKAGHGQREDVSTVPRSPFHPDLPLTLLSDT